MCGRRWVCGVANIIVCERVCLCVSVCVWLCVCVCVCEEAEVHRQDA